MVENASQVEAAFQVYDSIRRPCAQTVVRESLEVGSVYFFAHPNFGTDLDRESNKSVS
jgi:salicylate hydroxylase